MLKKIIVSSLLFVASSLFAITEGKEYTVLSANEQLQDCEGTVVELFSYGCIHCYNQFRIDSMILLSELLPNYKFEEWQVREMGRYGEVFTKILVYANALDREEGLKSVGSKKSYTHKIIGAYLEANFKFRIHWSDDEDFAKIALDIINKKRKNAIGLADIEDFAKTKGKDALKRMHSAINVARISGTPAFVVDGKYLVNIEEINSQDDLLSIVKALSELKK